jgi:hypothetical protein
MDGWLILRPSILSASQVAALKSYLDTHIRQSTRFDHAFDAENGDALYCSELVSNAFEAIHIQLLDHSQWNRADLLYPNDFRQSPGLIRVMGSFD